MENINTIGTFQEYMESVRDEVERQLGCDYAVELVNMGKQLWSTDSDLKFLTYQVRIYDNEGWHVHFSICEMEFDRNMQQSEDLSEFEQSKRRLKSLTAMAHVRFIDAEWSLKYAKEHASV